MARVARDNSGEFLKITISKNVPNKESLSYNIGYGNNIFSLIFNHRVDNVLFIKYKNLGLEQVAISGLRSRLLIFIEDNEDSSYIHVEDLSFEASFFEPYFDISKSTFIPPFSKGTYKKPERLAVMTHVYNDWDSLRIWENHYMKLVDSRHIYVIDHGSTVKPSHALHPDTKVITIPRGDIDQINISQFCSYFQRFLLTQYQWVMHTDSDELLVHRHGMQCLLDRLDEDNYGPIVRAKHAAELLDHTWGAEPLDLSRPISLQRHLLEEAPAYRKPILGSVPISWSIGFHQAYETWHLQEDDDLWLLHLRYADLQFAVQREKTIWSGPLSTSDQFHTPQNDRATNLNKLIEKINATLSTNRFSMPDWMVGCF